MHNAPSVTYPVGRSRWGAALPALAWVAGAVVSWQWTSRHDPGLARTGVAFLAVTAAGLLAAWQWRCGPCGTLAWDGANWTWNGPAGPGMPGSLHVALDLQAFLLVRWHGAPRAKWLWLERTAGPDRWDDLRRAVYSRARPEALPVAEPPAAKT